MDFTIDSTKENRDYQIGFSLGESGDKFPEHEIFQNDDFRRGYQDGTKVREEKGNLI